jgi:hypothetical protein
MNIALDHLGDLPLFWINLDVSRDRRDHMNEHVVDLFHPYESEHVSAVHASEVTEIEADEFVTSWQRLWADHGNELHYANRPPGDKFRMNTQKANIAIRRSHLKALQRGIFANQARFVVAEDDIMPRNTLLNGEVPLPPADADVAIWSGGLPMAGTGQDDYLFKKGTPHRWVRVQGRDAYNALGAGCYEVTKEAADHIMSVAGRVPMSWDHAWGKAFQDLTVYRLRPNAFAQVGPSVRNGKVREPAIERKSA